MDLFALHGQRHLRRGELYLCLEPLGFTEGEVDAFIKAGIIPAKHIPHPRRKKKRKQGGERRGGVASARVVPDTKPKPNPKKAPKAELIQGRAYYVVSDVMAGLGLVKPAR